LDRFEAWFRDLGSYLLLFLNNVQTVTLIDLRRVKPRQLCSYAIRRSRTTTVSITLPRGATTVAARRTVARDSEGREWLKLSASVPVPKTHRRMNKATGPFTDTAGLHGHRDLRRVEAAGPRELLGIDDVVL